MKYGIAGLVLVVMLAIISFLYNQEAPENKVVIYAALDQEFSEPILKQFEEETGIQVEMVFDAESTKTIGLVNRLMAEGNAPVCDVFWNNEPVNTIRLKEKGRLQVFRPKAAADFPAAFRDPDGMWTGFAARARVLLVNTDLVPEGQIPSQSWEVLRFAAPERYALPAEYEQPVGLAKPLFGSTATWCAVLYTQYAETTRTLMEETPEALEEINPFMVLQELAKAPALRMTGGNKSSATNTADGSLAMGFTDTDDAIIEVEAGKPVRMVYLDSAPGEAGVLFFPNTLAMIRDCPHPENAKKLIEYLLRPEVEIALANGPSAQIPVNPAIVPGEDFSPRVKTPSQVAVMEVDWDKVAADWDGAAAWVKSTFDE